MAAGDRTAAAAARGGRRLWQACLLGAALLAGAEIAFALRDAVSFGFVSPGAHNPRARGESSVQRAATQTLERKKTQRQDEYRLAVGHAIDILRRDAVLFFQDPEHVPDLSVYSEELVVADARAPGFELRGLSAYRSFLSALQWSLSTACDHSKLEITAVQPPVHGSFRMRWRLHLWPKDVLAPAKEFFTPALGPGAYIGLGLGSRPPVIVEGYSVYELSPWTAEVVKQTIDITNPPMLIKDLLPQAFGQFAWMPAPPVSTGVRFPSMGTEPVEEPAVKQPSIFAWAPSLPQGCEDDFECNDGKANFPLQCCELPILGKFCCEPEDFTPAPQGPAYVPIPVPSDPWGN